MVKPSRAANTSLRGQFLEYTLFVSFFPQLIAGPIVHHGQIIPHFQNPRTFVMNWRNFAIGLSLFSLGLFKKVVIADTLSPWAADGFDNSDALTFVEAWAAALSYTLQIYFDFSGYSDMALGLGKFFNIDIPMNFNSPYKSTSIIEFWRRWHMTLSQFLRDYIYIPLGGNRLGETRRYVNLFLTMLIGGLWHGAAWQFVFWGFLHGIYLCVNHLWRKLKISLPNILSWLITFVSVVIAWVFFRAESFERAWSIIKGMCGVNGVVLPGKVVSFAQNLGIDSFIRVTDFSRPLCNGSFPIHIMTMLLLLLFSVFFKNSKEWTEKKFYSPTLKTAVLIGLFFAVAVGYLTRVSEFLYFQF